MTDQEFKSGPDFKRLSDGNAKVELMLELSVGRVLRKVCRDILKWRSYISEDELQHVADWLQIAVNTNEPWLENLDKDARPKKVMKFYSIDQIVKEADKAIAKASQKMRSIKIIPGDEELFAELSDGYYVVRLLSPSSLDRESQEMQHCIGLGGYDKKLKAAGVLYLSLRDAAGKAHATLEVKNKRVVQLRGKQNDTPVKRYLDVLEGFIAKHGFSTDVSTSVLRRVIDANGIWHDVTALPNGLTIDGDLDLSRTNITTLPRDLKVQGDLRLIGTRVAELPRGLVVNGDLDLGDTPVEILPEGLIVGGDLRLANSRVTRLPKNLQVGGRLNIMDTAIEEIPSCISVGTDLLMSQSRVSSLPHGITVNGNLRLNRTPFMELPDNLTVSGDLECSHTAIKNIPKNLHIGGCLIASDTSVRKLPSDLKVKGTVFISGTPLNEIEQGFKVGRGLHACHTLLRTLPEGFRAGGDVDLRRTPLDTLPGDLFIGGKLEISGTPLDEIPETIKVRSVIFADVKLLSKMGEGHPLYNKMQCLDSIFEDVSSRRKRVSPSQRYNY
jgi:hypothetical protein